MKSSLWFSMVLALAPAAFAGPADAALRNSDVIAQHEGHGSHGADPGASGGKVADAAPPAAAKENALANAVVARTPEEQAHQSGFSVVTILDHWLGIGTFVDPKLYSYLAANLNIMPRYQFALGGVRLAASAMFRIIYEYTMPDVETGRHWTFWDVSFGLSAPALLKEKLTGISLTPSLGLIVPSTPESIAARMIASVSVGVGLTRSVSLPHDMGLDFAANVSGRRTFYANASGGYRPPDPNARDQYGAMLTVCRPGEAVCALSTMNPAWVLTAGGQVSWRATGELVFYVAYTFLKTWKYAATPTGLVDDYTPKALDSAGNQVAKALGSADRTFAVFGGSYQLNEHYSVDLSASTIQTPLTPTRQVRFPFWSIGTAAENNTTVNLTLTAAY